MEEMIDSIRKTTFTKDDVLVLTCEQQLTDDQYKRILDATKEQLPFNNKVMLLEGGLQLSVMTQKDQEDSVCHDTECPHRDTCFPDNCELTGENREQACLRYKASKNKAAH